MNAFRVWLRVRQFAILSVVFWGTEGRGLTMEEFPEQIGVLWTCFSAGAEQVDALLSQHRRDGDDAALRTAVEALLDAGNAELTEMAYGITRSASEMQVESVVERIYPTENDPAEIPQELRGPISAALTLKSHATPTAFESRATGLTVQMTPQASADGRVVELDLRFDAATYVDEEIHGRDEAEMRRPIFDSHQVTQQLVVENGFDTLAATLTSPGDPERKRILVFIRATILPPLPAEQWREREREHWKILEVELQRQQADANNDPFSELDGGDRNENNGLREQPGHGVARMVSATIEVVEAPRTHVFRLMRDRMTSSNAASMRGEIEQLIESGEAVLTHSSLISTRPSVPARSRSGPERIYPVEFDPPEMPQKVEGPLEGGVSIITPTHPTTFEMRAEGLQFGVDLLTGTIDDLIQFSTAPEVVRRVGFTEHGKGEASVRTPLFETRRVMTNAMVLDGNPILLSVHSQRTPEGKNTGTYSMMFLTAAIKKVPAKADAVLEAKPGTGKE